MEAAGPRRDPCAMSAGPSRSPFSRAWRHCGLCGRFFSSFPDCDRARRDCEDCGTARLVSSAPPISVRRLRLMGE
jgi:hypothetical protein